MTRTGYEVAALVVVAVLLATTGQAQNRDVITISPEATDPVPDDILLTIPVCPVLTTSMAPVIDGKLDDKAWQTAPRLGRMYLDTGDGPMKFDTIAKFTRDETYIFLAVDARHPKISDVPISAGKRDQVSWHGETVELFLDTDPAGAGYVQVIFDMSGAFTDTFAGHESFNGEIMAATDVGGTGWRLEARLKIADLAGEGKVDPHVWGANVARNTRGQAGSWARLAGSFQQPESFGLLTFARGGVAVDDFGVGVYAAPGLKAARVPVRIGVTELRGQRRELEVRYRLVAGDGASVRQPTAARVTLAGGQRDRVVRVLEAPQLRSVVVSLVERGAGQTLFEGTLPVRRATRPSNCLADSHLAAAVYPVRAVALSPEGAGVYVMAQSLTEAPIRTIGQLSLRAVGSDRVVWSQAVAIELGPYEGAARRIDLADGALAADDYRVEWQMDTAADDRVATTRVIYQPKLRELLRQLVVAADPFQALACPKPTDPRDAAIIQYKLDHLGRLLAQEADNIEIDLGTPMVRTYRKLRDIVFAVKTKARYVADVRGSSERAIVSTADGSRQPFALFVPHDYDENAGKTYRMIVTLHGASGTHGGEVGGANAAYADSFVLVPLGRGRFSGFDLVSGRDVVQEIQTVLANYQVDPNMVHLQGGSMGGYGSFAIGAAYPDLFATCTPLCGGGFGPVEQMVNLPTFVHHGLADNVVQPSNSILTVAQMRRGGCPVQMYLHPGIEHGVTEVAMAISTWDVRKNIRRNPDPQTVVLSGGLPALKKAYWLAICRYTDPHRDAYVNATFAGGNHLDLAATNVAWLRVSLPTRWIDSTKPVQITSAKGYRWTEIIPGEADAIYVRLDGDSLEASTAPPPAVNDPTAYLGGGARRLFTEGRPIRIVYGTAGSDQQTAKLAKLANDLRAWNAFGWNDFEVGGYPVLKDVDVDEAMLKSCDLIVLGTAAENALVARIAKDLPVTLADGQLRVATSPPMQWASDSACWSLYYRNPLAPTRRIWWFAGVYSRADLDQRLAQVTEWNMFNYGPDLIVARRSDFAVLATATLDGDWTLSRPGAGSRAAARWATPKDLHRRAAELIRQIADVEVSLVNPSEGLTTPGLVSWQDLTPDEAVAMIAPRRMMVIQLTGKDLMEFRRRAETQEKDPDDSWSGPQPESLKPTRSYSVLVDDDAARSFLGTWQEATTGRFIPAGAMADLHSRLMAP